MKANFRESNPIPVKWALERLGLDRRRAAPAARAALARAPRPGRGGAQGRRPPRRGGQARRERWPRDARGRRSLSSTRSSAARSARPRPRADGYWVANAAVKEGILAAFRLGIEEPCERRAAPVPRPRHAAAAPASSRGRARRPGRDGAPARRVPREGRRRDAARLRERRRVRRRGLDDRQPRARRLLRADREDASTSRRPRRSAASSSPSGAVPVVLEDEVFVGGGAGVYEGVCVRKRAVLAAGVILTASSVLFDLVHERELPLDARAPARRPRGRRRRPGRAPRARAPGASATGLSLAAPVIVKYRDAKTDARTVLESALR